MNKPFQRRICNSHRIREPILILLKGFRSLCNVTRSSVLVVAGVVYLSLQFIIINVIIIIVMQFIIINVIIIIVIITITFIINILILLLLWEFLSRAVYCSYEVSWPFGFVPFNFFICLNLIYTTTIWCWRTTLSLSFGII